jgi:hypothetical protein
VIFTHHVGSIGAPSRRTVFVRGTSAEQRESLEIIIIIIKFKFNSILYYLCAESTATRPITDTAQCSYT